MTSNETVYTRLCDVEGSVAGAFNVYGVIVNSSHKISQDYKRQDQDEYRLKLKDGTNEVDIDVTVFAILDSMPLIAFKKGNVIRFHRLSKKQFKDGHGFYLCGKLGIASALMFEPPVNGQKILFSPKFKSSSAFSHTKKDLEILTELIASFEKIIQSSIKDSLISDEHALPHKLQHTVLHIGPTQSLSQKKTPNLNMNPYEKIATHYIPSKSLPSSSIAYEYLSIVPDCNSRAGRHESCVEIKELVSANSNYYNVLCEVIACYKNVDGNVILRVWDGTQNAKLTNITVARHLKLVYGNLQREVKIAAAKRLYEVFCYDEHGISAQNLEPGDYVVLINVHFFTQKFMTLPQLVMHKGSGTIITPQGQISAERRISKISESETSEYFNFIKQKIEEGELLINKKVDDGFHEDIDFSVMKSFLTNNKDSDEFDEDIDFPPTKQ